MTRVWPALCPPWKRTTTLARSESQSTILPLPSSPHWEPTTATFAIRRLTGFPRPRPTPGAAGQYWAGLETATGGSGAESVHFSAFSAQAIALSGWAKIRISGDSEKVFFADRCHARESRLCRRRGDATPHPASSPGAFRILIHNVQHRGRTARQPWLYQCRNIV